MLNTLSYNVEFSDGEVREYSANIIAENMYAQVDAQGFHHNLLEAILDFKKDSQALDLVECVAQQQDVNCWCNGKWEKRNGYL